ncbi:hypothetical protein L6E12_09530 [Actinokineospora sp. PR83]|uniref:GHMP family kinase ATP-binding protein n=1 Tax=Actinokineospora sp. PR83 TaxID=2884908 RepID=UPI0027DF6284|nr:hypothetical protein [Actinokineospora sp. PR83]MCG8916029.1 hypothetical protein [Actinokineospora sp. PR83]
MTAAPQTSLAPTPVPRTTTVSGVCNGTLGELFQGPVTHRGRPGIGLVSFPVDRYAWAHFSPGPDDDPSPELAKAAAAVRLFCAHHGVRLPPGRWSRHSELDVGVGMASSTADIVATLRCLFALFGLPYDAAAVRAVLTGIERADSVFLDEFALYLSDRHEVVEPLGTRIGFHTCFVVEPGSIDTTAVTPLLLEHYRHRADSYRRCLDGMLAAFRRSDPVGVARAASTSAALSQEVLPKARYDAIVAHRREFGADGVFVAHTGRVIGYLFTQRLGRRRMDELSAFFHGLGHQCSFAWGGYGGA